MLRTLADKVRPEHCAILIVDVQNDFCAEGGAMHREGRDLTQVRAMVPRLARLIEPARAAKVRCIWIRNVYNTGPNWYLSEVWLEHAQRRRQGAYISIPVCEPDAWNGDFYQIKPLPAEPIVTKHRYGAFESSDLDLVLRSQGIRTVAMTGVATNVCVETTARQSLLRLSARTPGNESVLLRGVIPDDNKAVHRPFRRTQCHHPEQPAARDEQQ